MNPPTGVLEGGWDYIWAAYAVTWAMFLGYGVRLLLRKPRQE